MAWNEDIGEKIDNYLTNRLSETDRKAFEAEIASNPALKEEVEHQKLVMGAIIQFRKQELKEFIKHNTKDAENRRSAGPFWMSIAAAFILAVGAGYYVYFKQQRGMNMKEMAVKTSPSPELHHADKHDSINSALEKKEDLAQNDKISGKTSTGEKLTVMNEADRPARAAIANQPVENSISDKDSPKNNLREDTYLSKQETIISKNTIPEKKLDKFSESNKKKLSKPGRVDNYTDSIQGDVLLKDSEMFAGNIATALDLQKNKNNNTALNTISYIKVRYWQSSINFKGYQYHRKQLSLYGVVPSAAIRLRLYNSNLYLKMNGNVYLLKDDNYNYYDFSKPIEDKKLTDEIGFE